METFALFVTIVGAATLSVWFVKFIDHLEGKKK